MSSSVEALNLLSAWKTRNSHFYGELVSGHAPRAFADGIILRLDEAVLCIQVVVCSSKDCRLDDWQFALSGATFVVLPSDPLAPLNVPANPKTATPSKVEISLPDGSRLTLSEYPPDSRTVRPVEST